ncbi:1-pyrroline-5-carboxylate dehydrogenase [Thecamonas trahens ATCC 50062]|uniref:Multifunctional fusion protein n=1 Tax=Thecamonas trahens ATCC 50062 TaxID=461836 RepID=A0A0L0DLK4_THETB|nr:1-pyrroline-5-carboxylate dehydrogenase [Thecamonas trahens ATCC 50062]KNC53189.1 1-pyrroline-5-carboxylate dehydrogenase [Thecamonas trahens ATCC 50062]|eukprot:XP_013754661.1 1-pyrroline-5-carboxylate dehydrogenase [Thecamonas trahens ATCC 50062]
MLRTRISAVLTPMTRAYGSLGTFSLPKPPSEPMLNYAPGSPERAALAEALTEVSGEVVDIPCVVNGEEVYTGDVVEQVMPTRHSHVLARVHRASQETVQAAIDASLEARAEWAAMPAEARFAIFRKAADLVASKHRAKMCATVMLGTGKNVWQAEIDAAVETIDFFRFNTAFAEDIYAMQPPQNAPGNWNRSEYRPLEGFVLAVSPFNFCAIGANLCTAPAMMGNTVVWKPASTAALGNYYVYNILREAGLPDGVINFVPGSGPVIGDTCLNSPHLGGLHFTGSTETFNSLSHAITSNYGKYVGYPRVVGETGGKNFHFLHASADVRSAVNNTLRGAFEYQGQKCSATSRLYVPASLWDEVRDSLVAEMANIKVGQPYEFDAFMTAVIDKSSFDNISRYLAAAAAAPDAEVLAGGSADDSEGYFVEPTLIHTTDPHFLTMEEEIFGPVLTAYVYDDDKFEETLEVCASTSPYALTGAVFARDADALLTADAALKDAAGNFYVNDKSTGAVVGAQPFGGARASGTNDKAGSALNLLRWVSARTIKENYLPLDDWRYPHME